MSEPCGGPDEPRVSVLIITRDRPELLRNCIGSIVDSRYDNWEIVILDNGSAATRRSIEAHLDTLEQRERIRHVVSPPISFARMRQLAVDHASGEFLLSIDDDCVAEPDAMANLVRRFRSDASIGVVGGNIHNVGFDGPEQWKGRGRFTVNGLYEPTEDPYQAEVFGGGNASLRRSALDEAGGYDPFFSGGLDDADAVLSISERGYRVVYDPEVRITHYHTPARFRNLWRNIQIMRLYLFFKHFPPRGVGGWMRFAWNETGLLLRDVWGQIRAFRLRPPGRVGTTGYPKWLAKMIVLRAIELLKVVLARLAIPYLIWKARETRLASRPATATT